MADNNTDTQIQLKNVLWQALPGGVTAAYVGPDGRIWYVLRKEPGSRLSSSSVRESVEKQFNQTSPQLVGITPVLFEPQGRVWFTTTPRTSLWSYDGKDWIEYQAPDDHRFIGDCPGHERPRTHNTNKFFSSHAFFLDPQGVHVFGNNKWKYQRFISSDESRTNSIYLQPIQANREMLAACVGSSPSIWKWHDGEWSKIECDLPTSAAIIPWSENRIWVKKGRNAVRLVKLNVGDKQPSPFPELFEHLKLADDPQARHQISRKMIECGEVIRPDLDAALSSTFDSEVIAELVYVSKRLSVAPTHLTMEDCELDNPQLRYCDDLGTAYICCDHIVKAGSPLGPGLVIARPDGTLTAIASKSIVDHWKWDSLRAMLLPNRQAIWIPSNPRRGVAQLFDLDSGLPIDRLPHEAFHYLQSVTNDGRLFVSGGPLMLYTPGAPDDRTIITAQSKELRSDGSGRFCVDDNGMIWTDSADRTIVRFDGEQWETILRRSDAGVALAFIPGKTGSMLICFQKRTCLLVNNNGVMESSDLFRLVDKHREFVVRDFQSPTAGGCEVIHAGLTVDSGGNIWAMSERRLRVRTQDRWLEAKGPLMSSGSRKGEVEYIAGVGDGQAVYVSDLTGYGDSFLGKVVENKLVFTPAPQSSNYWQYNVEPVRETDGALWIPSDCNLGGRFADCHNGQVAYRLVNIDQVQYAVDAGFAKAVDQGGTVWLGNPRPGAPNSFALWENGSVVGSIDVPAATSSSVLFSDRPGSMLVWTIAGLYRYERDPEPNSTQYRFAERFGIKEVQGNRMQTSFSKLGYLVTSTYSDSPRRYHLYLIPLRASCTATEAE